MDQFINNMSTHTDNPNSQPIDSIILVSVSTNKLEATLYIKPPKNGGMEANIELLKESLESKNIIYGVNENLLIEISNNPDYNKTFVVARGLKPINGVDSTFNILFQTEKDSKPKEREDGTVDFHDLETVENVKKGQILCFINPPTEGKDGFSVYGDIIPGIKGKSAPSLLGKNTKLNDDGTRIFSNIDGQVEFINGKINVNQTLVIKENVDPSTGNIKAIGNVTINGSVLPGFVVEATGNIHCNSVVSSATLISGGNIVLKSGVTGGKLICEGDLTSRFIENTNAFVKGNIKSDYIMNSSIKCGKSIHTTSSISRIVGGSYLVGENVVTGTIGSIAGAKTHLEIGTDPATIERQQKLMEEIPLLENKIQSLNSLISLLQQFESANRLTQDKKVMLEDALFSYNKIVPLLESEKKELEQINESIRLKGYGKIICQDTIHPGTSVKIGSMKVHINEPLYKKTLYYFENEIRLGPTRG